MPGGLTILSIVKHLPSCGVQIYHVIEVLVYLFSILGPKKQAYEKNSFIFFIIKKLVLLDSMAILDVPVIQDSTAILDVLILLDLLVLLDSTAILDVLVLLDLMAMAIFDVPVIQDSMAILDVLVLWT